MPADIKDLREFEDADATRRLIYDGVLSSLQTRFPIEDKDYRLELADLKYDGAQHFTLEQQKNALMHDRQLRTPLQGTWRLTDKTSGQVMDERRDVIMHVPYYTPRNTMIYNGNEYTIANQARLRPGVYTRRRKTGEIEGHINVEPGSGKPFRLHLEPETGIFRVNVGQSNIPAYGFLKALGATDQELMKAWGPELTAVNAERQDPKTVDKLYERFAGYRFNPQFTHDQKTEALKGFINGAQVDPEVVARTLGVQNASTLSKDLLVRATHKLLAVSRGEEQPDDRDALIYSRVLGPEDLLSERIRKDAGKLGRGLMFKVRRDKNLKPIQRGVLNGYVDGLLFGSRLANPLEETNPLSTLEQANRITKLGEGGLSSGEAITEEARNVNNTQFGFIDPIATHEGMNAGVDLRASYRTLKGKDGRIYGEFLDRAGRSQYLNPEEIYDHTVAFPGESGPIVTAMRSGKIVRVPAADAEYRLPSTAHMFGSHININTMPTGVQTGRQFYQGKYWSSFMPMKDGELPLVDSLMPDGKRTFSEYYGRKAASLTAPVAGEVVKVTDKLVRIKSEDGTHDIELIKDFPFNRLTGISYSPSVEQGQMVTAGDLVAHSNFTDKRTGGLTMGRNLKAAVMPYRGRSFEDAYVITEDAAKKLAAERLFGFDQESRHGVALNRNKFMSIFPKQFTQAQIDTVDEDGVVKAGTIVNKGDPVILGVGPKLLTGADAQLGKLHKVLRNAHTDKSVVWDHEYPGEVVDAVTNPSGAKVNIKAAPPVKEGDKLSFGGLKGVVGHIIPSKDAPTDPVTNEPYEVLINPLGILSRVAPNHIVEISLAKLAKKQGKQLRLPQDPPAEGWASWAKKQLDDAGISETADVFDPQTGRVIKGVADGYAYVHAFHHLAEKKLSERNESGGYDINLQPTRGGREGSKKLSGQESLALLSHGATHVLKDALQLRGTKNEDYWKALRLGHDLPEPGVPFVYEKFISLLNAGGINTKSRGSTTGIMPMTDQDTMAMAHNELDNASMVDDEFKPMVGGLFDLGKTGGVDGRKWSRIRLNEPMVNPVMEEPVRRLLGLTQKEMLSVLAGQRDVNGLRGGQAIRKALEGIDIDKELARYKTEVSRLRGAGRDNAVKIVGYLSAAKATGIHPSSWVIEQVPVLPPVFRPVARMGDMALQADMNELYRDLIETNSALPGLRKDLPEAGLAHEKLNMYNALTAVYGLGDPITPEGRSKRLKGAIRQVIGEHAKGGLFQSQVISKPVIGVGRTVIATDPNLDMDSAGIPEDSAWALYKDFVVRRLVRRGYQPQRALELIQNRDPIAGQMLDEEMGERPVLLNRAPTWHRFNLLAFYPRRVPGNVLYIPPIITKGFTADADGDQMNFHVPVSEKAVDEAKEKMLPSKNLFSLTDLRSVRHSPGMEMTLGLYQMTQPSTNAPVKTFNTLMDARRAYHRGEIKINDPIEVKE